MNPLAEEDTDARRRRDDQGQARDGQGVRGRGQGARGQGQRQRAGVRALRASPRRGGLHLRVPRALRGPGGRRGPSGRRPLQDARPQDGGVHGRAARAAPSARGRVASQRRSAPLTRRMAVNADSYMKAVLTVIALALAVIALRPWLPESGLGAALRPEPAQAQTAAAKYEVTVPRAWGKYVA